MKKGNKEGSEKFYFVTDEAEQQEPTKKENNTHVNINTLMDDDDETSTKLFSTQEISIIQENLKAEKEERKINKFYFGYKFRVGFLIGLVLLFFTSGCCCIIHSLKSTRTLFVEYTENADTTFKVCLQSSDPYLTNCIDYAEGISMAEIRSLKMNFNYIAELKQDANVDLVYHILAINRIYDKFDSSKIIYENEDYLLSDESISFRNRKADVEREFMLDIKKYNDFVIDYQTKYPFSSEASLELIVYVSDGENTYEVGTMNIPLSVEKLMVYKNFAKQQEKNTEVFEREWTNTNTIYVVMGSLLIILSTIAMVFLTKFVQKTINKKTKYEKTLQNYLNTYDRIIVEARGGYESDIIKKVVKVASFDELLDARELLDKPIIYSRINNIKSEFIVEAEDKLYKYVLKEADIEKEEK